MIFGCIGTREAWDFCKDFYARLGGYDCALWAHTPNAARALLQKRRFRGVNVNAPFREMVLPHLDWLSPTASATGAVDAIVNRDGRLCGYNTEVFGRRSLSHHMGASARAEFNEGSLRSRMTPEAGARPVPAEGTLYMNVAQAVYAAELFLDERFPEALTEDIYHGMLRHRQNIVLIGMPGVGKSTIAHLLGQRFSRPVMDVDALVTERAGMPIREIFARFGEAQFRDLESAVVSEVSASGGKVIATGGGTVLRPQNVAALRHNGWLFLLDRPLGELSPSEARPLGDTRAKVERLFLERVPVYRAVADEIVPANGAAEAVADEIERRWRTHAGACRL